MKKILALLFIILFLTGCGKSDGLSTLKKEKLKGCNTHAIGELFENYLVEVNWREYDKNYEVSGQTINDQYIEISFLKNSKNVVVASVKINGDTASNDYYDELLQDMCTTSEIMDGDKKEVEVNVDFIYNDEAYFLEGAAKKVKATIYGDLEDDNYRINLDLRNINVNGEYQKAYYTYEAKKGVVIKIEPVYAKVLLSEKKAGTFNVTGKVKNNNPNSDLEVKRIIIDRDQLIVKASEKILKQIWTVEAIFDLNEIENMERGTYYRYSSEIIVRDKNGKIIPDVEIVPYQVTGKLQVDKK